MMKFDQVYLIALGGNLRSETGVPQQTLRAALVLLEKQGAQLEGVSNFYRTPCFPPGAGPDYVNAAARIVFDGDPQELLAVLHKIEAKLGREREQRWGRRTLDLDILAAGQMVLPDAQTHETWRILPIGQQVENAPDQLIVPHPRLQDRAFVLVPLADVAPNWVHPVLKQSVTEMLGKIDEAELREVVVI